jgi:GWxTD domain-containing protein
MMTVYFQRVDYAFANFRTLKEENGALTDRGKIYILYGKPSNVERSLAPGGPPKETWTYGSLNREFIFEDPSRQGNYKLIASGTK